MMKTFSQTVLEQLTHRRRRQLRELVRQLKAQGIALNEQIIFPAGATTIRQQFQNLLDELRANGIDLDEQDIFSGSPA